MTDGGRVLLHDRYDVLGEIGRGGMGAVLLAEDRRLPGRRCAVKAIHLPAGLAPAEADALRANFKREATLLAQLDHPTLPGVSDHFEIDGISYLVMDFVPGDDLSALVNEARAKDRHLEEARVVGWAEALCGALAYLHGRRPQIVHRDVKPSNIKLTPDGQVRLVDFGLAIPIGDDSGATLTVRSGGGSRAYQPLEQFGDGGAIDTRSDIYALGATLYHLLCGVPPADARARFLDPDALIAPRAVRAEILPHIEHALLTAMAIHPDDRPPSAAEFRRLLTVDPSRNAPPGNVLPFDAPPIEPSSVGRALVADRWLVMLLAALIFAALALSAPP